MSEVVDTILPEFDASPQPVKAGRARRKMSDSQRRAVSLLAGLALAGLGIGGFYLTSVAFDSRTPVLVAAAEIPEGAIVTSGDLTSALLQVDLVPHHSYSTESLVLFEGMLTAHAIPAGSVMREHMVVEAGSQATGNQMELPVALDTSLTTAEVFAGDEVLFIDPGVTPSPEHPGRPRGVLTTMTLRDFDGAIVRLLLAPDEWASWRAMLAGLGTNPMIMNVPLGGDAVEFGQSLDAVWLDQYSTLVNEIEAARPPVQTVPQAGPGELEVRVPLDTSLAPSGVANGQRALLVDPGVEPTGDDRGRPRSVLRPIVIENFQDGQMRLFTPPDEWAYWQSLTRDLNATPLVLAVPPGTDERTFIALLDAEWLRSYESAIRALFAPGEAS